VSNVLREAINASRLLSSCRCFNNQSLILMLKLC
jgi:hypothetical protein